MNPLLSCRPKAVPHRLTVLLVLAVVFWLNFPVAAQSYSQAYTFTTLAGYSGIGSADGVGSAAQFNNPLGVVVDTNGNIYVADFANSVIRKITPAGLVTTIAGFPGVQGFSDGTNSAARFYYPIDVALDRAGNLYVADWGDGTIREVRPVGTNWVVSTIASIGFIEPEGLAVDATGNVYVADTRSNTICKLTPVGTNWVASTIAGLAGTNGSADGTNSVARFNGPSSMAMDGNGDLFVVDSVNSTIRKLTPNGTNWVVTTIAGSPGKSGSADGTNSQARFSYSPGYGFGVAVDDSGNLLVADSLNRTIRKITPMGTNWVVTTLAGTPMVIGTVDATGTNALFGDPQRIAAGAAGNIYVSDYDDQTIRKINSAAVVSTIAGLPGGGAGSANGAGATARFYEPYGIAVDMNGTVYVADSRNFVVREITSLGQASTLAGLVGAPGTNDGTGSSAQFGFPVGITVDIQGNVYVAEPYNNTIRLITPVGQVSTIAGAAGLSGTNDGMNGSARFNRPNGLAVDANGNVYVTDCGNYTIRKLAPQGTNWVVSTIAGTAGIPGATDGTNNAALFGSTGGGPQVGFGAGPTALAVDQAGNLYVADVGNYTIRKVAPMGTNWVVTTIAGSAGSRGTADGINNAARFGAPCAIATDKAGNIYVAEPDIDTIRKVTPAGTNWIVTTIGGSIYAPGSADGTGEAARFYFPFGIAADDSGAIYVADTFNYTIRKGVFTQYGSANMASGTTLPGAGRLQIVLQGANGNGQWRFPWETAWRANNSVASNLVPGSYAVEFRSLPGYVAVPPNYAAIAVAGNGLTSITNQYYPTLDVSGTTNTGGLTVNIGPNVVTNSGWRFIGESSYRLSGTTVTNLLPDTYFIEFAPVNGFSPPPSQAVVVFAGEVTSVSVNYTPAQSVPGSVTSLPVPVGTNAISDLTDYPFGFNGQLQTDVGYGSGVAVSTNVVLTAAHLVFNDETLSYVNQAYWFWQQEPGGFTEVPQQAEGWYVLSGYAAQRTNDLQLLNYSPDESSPQSRNEDVAALYFGLPVAGGSYGGYLPSDAQPNTWLTSTAEKMLVGYPVDGSVFGANVVNGQMYQTLPQPYPLSLDTELVTGQQEVYTASWFLSYPGNSGGPFYIQLNGYYYPAGVYLGTLYNGIQPYASLVRGIDSNVVNLINLAAALGSGTNNSGGVITLEFSGNISANNPARLFVQLGPPAAVAAGAAWRLAGDAAYSTANNYVRAITTTNPVSVQFKPIPGWVLPAGQTLTLSPNSTISIPANYTVASPVVVAGANGISLSGTSNTVYRLEYRTNLTKGSWLPLNIYTIPTNGPAPIFPKPGPGSNVFYRAVWLPLGTNTYSIFTNPVMVATAKGIGISGILGTTYRIESRTNLTKGSWTGVSTNEILTNGFNIFLPPPANNHTTFYRAVWLGY